MNTVHVGVISDTHGLLRPEACRALAGVEHILHAGDIGDEAVLAELARLAPVTAVLGNNDHGPWTRSLPHTAEVTIGSVTILMTHIIGSLAVDPRAAGASVVVFGHSHRPENARRGGVLYFNPGSAGPRRFSLPVTVGRLRVTGRRVEAEVLDLERRAGVKMLGGGTRATTRSPMPTTQKSKTATSRRRVPRKSTARPGRTTGLRLQACTPSLTVNDIDKSVAWYRDVLGFKVKERWENDGELMGAEMAAGSVSFYIGQDDWKKGRRRAKGEGFRVYCTTTQDIDSLAGRIKAARGRLAEPPHDEPWGGRALTVTDLDGFKITITKG